MDKIFEELDKRSAKTFILTKEELDALSKLRETIEDYGEDVHKLNTGIHRLASELHQLKEAVKKRRYKKALKIKDRLLYEYLYNRNLIELLERAAFKIRKLASYLSEQNEKLKSEIEESTNVITQS